MKYNDNGVIKDIVVKAGDTLPVGTVVEYDGDTIPAGYEVVEDVVVGNGWTMIKSENGQMIGYCNKTFTKDINVAWGNMYRSDYLPFDNYPVPFIEKPTATITQTGGSSGFIMNWSDTANTPAQLGGFVIVRPTTSTSSSILLSAIVMGRWK